MLCWFGVYQPLELDRALPGRRGVEDPERVGEGGAEPSLARLAALSAERDGSMGAEMLRRRELRRSLVEKSERSEEVRPLRTRDVVFMFAVWWVCYLARIFPGRVVWRILSTSAAGLLGR
jgi:hypothetical protein